MERFSHFVLGFLVAIIAWQGRSLITQAIADGLGITEFYTQTAIVILIIGAVALGIHFGVRWWQDRN
jgi:hypothetical protein